MSNQKKKKKKEEKKNPLDDVPPHLRDFIESIALKEMPESPGAMRKKASAVKFKSYPKGEFIKLMHL